MTYYVPYRLRKTTTLRRVQKAHERPLWLFQNPPWWSQPQNYPLKASTESSVASNRTVYRREGYWCVGASGARARARQPNGDEMRRRDISVPTPRPEPVSGYDVVAGGEGLVVGHRPTTRSRITVSSSSLGCSALRRPTREPTRTNMRLMSPHYCNPELS